MILGWALLFCLSIESTRAQDMDIINLEFARSFHKEQIHFIEKINDNYTIAASQKNAYLFNGDNLVVDTLNEIQNQDQNNLIQNIEVLSDDMVFIGTMKNLLLLSLINDHLTLVKNIPYSKSFPPWKNKHQLRFLTKNGFLGITIPLAKKTLFEIWYYPRNKNYQDKILLYQDTQSDYSVFSRAQWSKNVDFINDKILLNDFYRSKSIIFDPVNNTTKIIELPKYEGFSYSFISYDKKTNRYYLLTKTLKGNTEIRKYDIDKEVASHEKWTFEQNVFCLSNDNIWYKKLMEPDRILALFSLPFDKKTKESTMMLNEVIIDDQRRK